MVLGLSPPLISRNWYPTTRGKYFRSFLLAWGPVVCWFIWLTRNKVVLTKCLTKTLLHVIFRGMHWLRSWAQNRILLC